MTTEQLLDMLEQCGIVLTIEGEDICYEARPGSMTGELRQAIKAHKPALLELLRAGQSPPKADTSEPAPQSERPKPKGQVREPCAKCSGIWHLPAAGGNWACSMCLARQAAATATASTPGLIAGLLDFVNTLAVVDPEGTTTGRDWIEVFAPYQHARGMRPSPPGEIWCALEELGYEVRGVDTLQPLVIGLRLALGKQGQC